MTDSTPPPPTSGGGMQYAIIGILLLLGAGGLYFFAMGGDEDSDEGYVPPVVDAGEVAMRSNPYEPTFDIPEEEEDAGVDAGEEDTPEEPATMMSTMRRAQVECEGEIDPSAVRAVVTQQQSAVRACYERALKRNNFLQGNVTVSLRVQPDGSVEGVRVGGSLGDSEVFSCVRRLATGWQLPRPRGGCANVRVPFALTPRR